MLKVADWSYLGEGNANLVVFYSGSNPSFIGKCLRLTKLESALTTQESLKYHQEAVKLLFGKEYLAEASVVNISKQFLQTLSIQIVSSRPQKRLFQNLNLNSTEAILMTNLSYQQEVSIEIKPKWGFSPYRKSCRFCLHQKLRSSLDEKYQPSKYCPLDLFSKNPLRVQQAIKSLFETPQNNFKVHSNTLLLDQISLSQLLALVLDQSNVLEKLKNLQIEYHENVKSFEIEKSCSEHDKYSAANLQDTITNTSNDKDIRLARLMLSISLKDLSLFITFKTAFPDEFVSNPAEHLVCNSSLFRFNITIIDLDLKSCSKLEKLKKLEDQIESFT
jgi:Inositol-pentakisphosphate 2-kinase